MTPSEARRVVVAVVYAADDFMARYPTGNPLADAAQMGMGLLRDHLRRVVDFSELLAAEPPAADVMQRVEAFCRGHCPCSRVGPPGDHKLCEGCQLQPLTVGAEQAQVNDAMTINDGQGESRE